MIASLGTSSQYHVTRPALAPSLSFAKKTGEGNGGGPGNSGQGNNNKDDKDDKDKKDKKDKDHREDDDSEADADAGEQEHHDEADDEPDHPDESEGEQEHHDEGDGEQQQADEADGEAEDLDEADGEPVDSDESEAEHDQRDEGDGEQEHLDQSGAEQEHHDEGDGEEQQADGADGAQQHGDEAEGDQEPGDEADGEQQQADEADGGQEHGDKAEGDQEPVDEADSEQQQADESDGGQEVGDEAEVVSNEESGDAELITGDAAVEETGADATTESADQPADESDAESASPASTSTPFLMLSGTPPEAVTAGELYLFTPRVETNGVSPPAFAIDGLPHWAGFDEITGELYGAPDDVDIGLYEAITIRATDGVVETSLPTFSIEVVAPGTALGAVTLSWMPPTRNEDGSYLNDLAGYWIYWGNNPGTYTEWLRIDNPGLTSIVIEDLVPGSWEFAMTSFNAADVESSLSNAVTRFVD